jgi:hypothetical protein
VLEQKGKERKNNEKQKGKKEGEKNIHHKQKRKKIIKINKRKRKRGEKHTPNGLERSIALYVESKPLVTWGSSNFYRKKNIKKIS